ncbi:MAG TPA: winged helix-turn-helix domain-containing protein [Candidatus Binatia bacterium]|nr:winged helix-turn-helix domain-containing protein [Candidatus Binatia bacterium]
MQRQSVKRWATQLAAGGRAALKHPGRAGRKPRLSERDRRTIIAGLQRGPEGLGFATSLWTAERVAQLIDQTCHVRYHPGHVWRILKQLGWSCQRTTGRALERDETAIARWKRHRWPALTQTLPAKGKRSSSSTRAGCASGAIAVA